MLSRKDSLSLFKSSPVQPLSSHRVMGTLLQYTICCSKEQQKYLDKPSYLFLFFRLSSFLFWSCLLGLCLRISRSLSLPFDLRLRFLFTRFNLRIKLIFSS